MSLQDLRMQGVKSAEAQVLKTIILISRAFHEPSLARKLKISELQKQNKQDDPRHGFTKEELEAWHGHLVKLGLFNRKNRYTKQIEKGVVFTEYSNKARNLCNPNLYNLPLLLRHKVHKRTHFYAVLCDTVRWVDHSQCDCEPEKVMRALVFEQKREAKTKP